MVSGARVLLLACAALGQVLLVLSSEPSVAEGGDCLLQRHGQVAKMGIARQELPDHLFEMGKQVFKDEEGLNKIVAEATKVTKLFAGVQIELYIRGNDNAAQRLGEKTEDGGEYGLETLLDARHDENGMVNMIDMGGNYGAVTIAVFKKFPGLVRTVVVEPVAPTYFFLRWNLWLNKVPDVTKEEFMKEPKKPGVVAVFGGATEERHKDLLMCAHPEWSMNAHFVEKFDAGWGCDCSIMSCTTVPGITTESLFDFFGKDAVTLMKMDCEGCEFQALPGLAKDPTRVKRLVGELHVPEEHLIDTACLFDNGRFMTKVCKTAEDTWASSLPLECNQQRKLCRSFMH